MGRKSTVLNLPDHVLEELNSALVRGRLSLKELRDFIARCDGVERVPSESALGRYSMTFKETAAVMRENREMATALAQELGPESVEGDQGRLLVEILRGIVFKTIQARANDPNVTESFDANEVAKIARSLKDLSHTMRLEQDFAKKIKEEARKEVANATETAARDAGVDEASIAAIMGHIAQMSKA